MMTAEDVLRDSRLNGWKFHPQYRLAARDVKPVVGSTYQIYIDKSGSLYQGTWIQSPQLIAQFRDLASALRVADAWAEGQGGWVNG